MSHYFFIWNLLLWRSMSLSMTAKVNCEVCIGICFLEVSWVATTPDTTHDGKQEATQEDKLIVFCEVERSRQEMMDFLGLVNRRHFGEKYMKPLLQSGRLRMTLPDKPQSKNQKYIATKTEMERAQAIMDNNPVLEYSPGDLRREGQTVEEYLVKFGEAERKRYLEYYEDEV